MIETTQSKTPKSTALESLPDPFQPENTTLEAQLLEQLRQFSEELRSMRAKIESLEVAVQEEKSESSRVKRLAAEITKLNALLADKNGNSALVDNSMTVMEEIGRMPLDNDRIAAISYLHTNPNISFLQIKEAMKTGRIPGNINSNSRTKTKDPETKAKKIVNKTNPNTISPNSVAAELIIYPKSRLEELYVAVSNYKDPILRMHAVLLCQESKDKLTPQELRYSMKIAVFIFNEYNGKIPPQQLQELIRKNTFSTSRSTKNNEILPEVPDAVSEFINDLKSKTSCDPKTLSEDEKQLYKRNRRLLKIAYDLSGEKTFLDSNNANTSCKDFSIKVQRRYDWEMDTGKAMKDTIVGGISTVIGKLPFFSQKQEKDSNTNNQGLVIELVKGTFIPLETVEHFLKRPISKVDFDDSIDKKAGSPITLKSTIETLGTNTPIPEVSIGTKVQPSSEPLGSKSATPEKLSNQEVEAIRTAIINVCNQFISILNSKGLNSNTLGFQKLIKYSETATSASVIKSAFKQLKRLTNDYSDTPNDRKKELLVKSNNEFLRILGELEKLPQTPNNSNGGKKSSPH